MHYTIGEVAKIIGVAPSALRYYDKEGLLPFVERSESGIRMFKESDLEWLSVIECLKKTGMPIREIGQFVDWCMEGDSTIGKRMELIRQQKAAVEKQMEQLKSTMDTLNYKLWYYEKANEAGTCAVHETIRDSDIPPDILGAKKRMKRNSSYVPSDAERGQR